MLPDYPSIKGKIEKKFEDSVKKEIQKDTFLSSIKIHRIHEGNILTASSIDGYTESEEYKLISSKFEIKSEEIIDKGTDAYFSKIDGIAKEMAKQQSQLFFKKIDKITERTGNVVNGKSKPFPQVIHEALEKVAIDFDEYGNPIFPSLILNPKDFEKIKDDIPKWESDPELQKKFREIMEKKRREWIDRENNRKLVD